jgi:hypothetical protein
LMLHASDESDDEMFLHRGDDESTIDEFEDVSETSETITSDAEGDE